MIFLSPPLADADRRVLALIEDQKQRLRLYTQNNPTRWMGSLRRSTFARALVGSNSIEGYHATVGDAIAVLQDEQTMETSEETRTALAGYRDAMTFIIQAAADPHFEFAKQFLKSLQFMMLRHDMTKSPGQWRPGPVFVVEQRSGNPVYEGPDAALIDGLMDELVASLRAEDDGTPVLVRAALAHLNLAMIHPFRDGNGRMARALQTLVLARDGILHPVFSSIEEWLGNHTPEYYRSLAAVGRGRWTQASDALPWVRFCFAAHYQQAATLIRRNEDYARLYEQVVAMIARARLPDRSTIPVFDATLGWRITSQRYRSDAEVAEHTASRDLRALCEAGLLEPVGEKRGRHYRRTSKLETMRNAVRIRQALQDPYDVIRS